MRRQPIVARVEAGANLRYRLVPASRRRALAAFDRFAAAARAVADDAGRAAEDRIERLNRLAAADPPGGRHALHLLQAARKDVTAGRYRSWSELLAYCGFAAAPIGRYLLELMGGPDEARRPIEALYVAMRVLSCVRDCKPDYVLRGRVYVPADWMRRAGAEPGALAADRSTPELGIALGRLLDGADGLLATAASGPAAVHGSGFGRAIAVAFHEARRSAEKLRRGDPLAGSLELTAADRTLALLRGLLRR